MSDDGWRGRLLLTGCALQPARNSKSPQATRTVRPLLQLSVGFPPFRRGAAHGGCVDPDKVEQQGRIDVDGPEAGIERARLTSQAALVDPSTGLRPSLTVLHRPPVWEDAKNLSATTIREPQRPSCHLLAIPIVW